jgi:hypothetical protein
VLFVGQNGPRFELTILGYQFPAIVNDEWDSNWLTIRIHAQTDRGGWSATDPSLTTADVARLADWLEGVAERRVQESDEVDFIEPNLSFGLHAEAADTVTLRIWFDLESRPPWAPSDAAGERDVWIDLDARRDDARRAAAELRTQLQQFPPRALTT